MFATAVMDAPWRYGSPGWKGGVDKEYNTLPIEALQELPIDSFMEPDSHLWMWTTDTHYELTVEMADKWGFEKRGTWQWEKLCKNPLNLGRAYDRNRLEEARKDPLVSIVEFDGELYLPAWGNGHYGRSSWESLILFTRGSNLVPVSHKARHVRKSFHFPLQDHSAKPKGVLDFISTYSPEPRIELFARDEYPGFSAWGNEVSNLIHPALDEWSEWAHKNFQTPPTENND